MKISGTQNQQLTDEIQPMMACKLLIPRSAKSISDRLLGLSKMGGRIMKFEDAPSSLI
jgi:hypothetical protein